MLSGKKAFLVKYAEIGVKGKNRILFEERLVERIRYALRGLDGTFRITHPKGRVYVEPEDGQDEDAVLAALSKVFGITGISPAAVLESMEFSAISDAVIAFLKESHTALSGTFKVNARRANKGYPMDSMEINAAIGERILETFPQMKVDVHEPQLLVTIELRERVYIYDREIPGPGGMPVGSAGRATLLLSGGIDSPVAGYMIAKRGASLHAVYYHAPPYTSERAKQKVLDLAKTIASYGGPIRLHVVNFTDIQMYIYEKCPHDQLTIIMRRYMMKIAEHLAHEEGSGALITGESLGQVASQTMASLDVTNRVVTLPVYRPLIGMDKQEIITRAEAIGTYETSILPYEDCCTIFVAKHPVTKPRLNAIEKSETHLSERIDALTEEAISTAELFTVEG